MSVFACVLPHLYSGVCVMQMCNVCVHLEYPDGDTMYSILGDTIHVQKAWYTNLHRISGLYTCTSAVELNRMHVHDNVCE